MANAFHSAYVQPGITGPGHIWGNVIESTGDFVKFTFTVPSGYHNIRLVLTWPDPAGSAEVANDLDLYVYNNSSCTGSPIKYSLSYDDTVEFVQVPAGYAGGTWCARVSGFSLSSANQTFGLVLYGTLTPPSLQIASSLNRSYTGAGQSLFYYTTVSNSGAAAGGSFVRVAIPQGLTLLGARVYTDDGRSHYYEASELYFNNGYWRVAAGNIISGSPRLVRWYLQVDSAAQPGAYVLYANAYHRRGGASVASINSRLTSVIVPGVYLPVIGKN